MRAGPGKHFREKNKDEEVEGIKKQARELWDWQKKSTCCSNTEITGEKREYRKQHKRERDWSTENWNVHETELGSSPASGY